MIIYCVFVKGTAWKSWLIKAMIILEVIICGHFGNAHYHMEANKTLHKLLIIHYKGRPFKQLYVNTRIQFPLIPIIFFSRSLPHLKKLTYFALLRLNWKEHLNSKATGILTLVTSNMVRQDYNPQKNKLVIQECSWTCSSHLKWSPWPEEPWPSFWHNNYDTWMRRFWWPIFSWTCNWTKPSMV